MTVTHSVEETMIHAKREKQIHNKSRKFSQQHVHLSDIAFLPEGYEAIFLALYFMFLPYIVGLMFQFFYICAMKVDVFLSLFENTMFMFIWAMGYELIAFVILMFIANMAINFSKEDLKPNMQKFRIP